MSKKKKYLSWDDILKDNYTEGGTIINYEGGSDTIINYEGGNKNIKKNLEKIIHDGINNECSFAIKNNNNQNCVPIAVLDKIQNKVLSVIDTNGGNKNDNNDNNDNNSNNINKKIAEYFNCDGDEKEKCVLKNIKNDKKFHQYIDPNKIDDLIKRYFKPEGPKETFNFLSNHNIDQVLSQFYHRYSDEKNKFYNIGFQLRDFAKYDTELENFDFYEKITENHYKTFGVVINTDVSTGAGIHWFCLFIDARNPEYIDIEYFNSSGRKPLVEIQQFLEKTRQTLLNKFENKKIINIKYASNIQLQEDGHSCGVWSLTYIWLRLEGVPAEWFNPSNIDDSIMHSLRKYFFTNDDKEKRTYGGNKLDKKNKYL